MRPEVALTHEFVRAIPDELQEHTIYVSIDFATVAHKCCCGCGREVVTPLSPTDWRLIFDGETVSLEPSVGSWNLPCQSHYWIKHDKVQWSRQWSREQVAAERAADARAKARYYGKEIAEDLPPISVPSPSVPATASGIGHPVEAKPAANMMRRIKIWLFGE